MKKVLKQNDVCDEYRGVHTHEPGILLNFTEVLLFYVIHSKKFILI